MRTAGIRGNISSWSTALSLSRPPSACSLSGSRSGTEPFDLFHRAYLCISRPCRRNGHSLSLLPVFFREKPVVFPRRACRVRCGRCSDPLHRRPADLRPAHRIALCLFGQAPVTQTVLEARGWSPGDAWSSFNYGLLSLPGDFSSCLEKFQKCPPHQIFLLAWSAVIFFATWQHVRYEYYLCHKHRTALCCRYGICPIEQAWPAVHRAIGAARKIHGMPNQKTTHLRWKAGRNRRKNQKRLPQGLPHPITRCSGSLPWRSLSRFSLVGTSVSDIYASASLGGIRLDPDWEESLVWMGNNTPDPGVPYLGPYDQKTFAYPRSRTASCRGGTTGT